jgi:hypothetical protein
MRGPTEQTGTDSGISLWMRERYDLTASPTLPLVRGPPVDIGFHGQPRGTVQGEYIKYANQKCT